MKITKTQLLKLIKEETEGEMQFAPLETARKAYLQDPNDDTRHELGLMVQRLVEPLMNEMGLFWEAESYYNVGDLVFNNRQVDVTIDPKGAMGRYDVNVSPVVSAMDTDPAFEPMDITVPSMKGVVQFINDKVFKSSGMAGEPEAQTELPFGKGGLTKENKMKITKSQLRQIIKEEVQKELDSDESLQELFGGIKKFLKGRSDQVDPYSTKEQSAIEDLALRIEQDKEGKYKEATQKMFRKDRVKGEEAISVAIGILGEPGFGQKKSSGGAVGYDASSFSDKDRAEIAGMKRQQRDQRNASRPTYASAKSDDEARKMLRARSGR